MSRLWWAFALVLLLNITVIVSVAYNRWAGEPQRLTLTERELARPGGDDNRRLMLRWQSSSAQSFYGHRVKVSEQRYRELGFGCAQEVDAKHRKPAWMALAYDGPAFQRLLDDHAALIEQRRTELDDAGGRAEKQRLERAIERLQQLRDGGSRLVMVDVAAEAQSLPVTGPSQSVWHLPVKVRAYGKCDELQLSVSLTAARRLTLPLDMAREVEVLAPVEREDGEAPRYSVKVAVGALGWPWIEAIKTWRAEP